MDPSLLHSIGGAFHTYLHDFSNGAGLALHSAHNALFIILNPMRMLYLFAGVCMGLALGILPGIGGIAGTALLLPFTYDLDPPTAFALLLGLGATTTTADPIAAILFGAPGHAASAATTLDGYPMTRRGEAGRALGASYMAALIGGLFGAVLMAVALPVMRPIILYIGSPELLAHRRVRHFHGGGSVRQCAAARPDLRLFRHDAAHDRHRPAVGHAALDHGHIVSVGRPAAGAADARHLRAAGTVRSRDRPHGHRAAGPDARHQDRHAARHQGLHRSLVFDSALLLDRLGDGRDSGHRRLGDRLDFLRPRADD